MPAAPEEGVGRPIPKGAEFTAGTLVGGSYEIVDYLGRGAMGFVYRARHNVLGREYALKTLGSEQVSETSWRRFQIEAQAIAKMAHPNVVGIHNFALHHSEGNSPIPFYVMDLLVGKNLGEKLEENGSPPLAVLLTIFQQAAAGLGYAHSKGMIHRDVKPGNIVLLDQPDSVGATVKIVDFGIAKLTDSEYGAQKLTTAGEVFGSPLYMSPEQSMAQTLDPRTDIYSLGVTMFEALTGEPPFIAGSAVEVMMMHQSAPVPVINEVSEVGYPPEIQQIVETMLAKMPDDRYQSMEHVIYDLAAIARGQEPTLGVHTATNISRVDGRSTSANTLNRLADTAVDGGSEVNESDFSDVDHEPEQEPDDEEPEEKSARTIKSLSIVLSVVAVVVSVALFFVSRPSEWMVQNSSVLNRSVSKAVASESSSSSPSSPSSSASTAYDTPVDDKPPDDASLDSIPVEVGVKVFKKDGTDYSSYERAWRKSEGANNNLRAGDRNDFDSTLAMTANHFGSYAGEVKPPSGSQNETFKFSSLEELHGVKVRHFKFPTDITLGRFEAENDELNIEAKGPVDLSPEVKYTFIPYRSVENYPQYFKRFSPGDIPRVTMWKGLGRDKLLNGISFIPGVTYLNITSDDGLTAPSVANSLHRLKLLNSFKAKDLKISASALAQAKCWTKLEKLDLNKVSGLEPLLKELKYSPELKGLTLQNCGLTSRDFVAIAALSNLRGLNVCDNKMTARDLVTLSKLPRLQYINVEKCGLSSAALEELKKFPSLQAAHVVSPAKPKAKPKGALINQHD